MGVLAIIPAKSRSTGIPGKNLTPLAGRSPMNRAIDLCNVLTKAGVLAQYYVSSDIDWAANERFTGDSGGWRIGEWIHRPAELATDTTAMIDVVRHVLEQIPGPPDQQIVLLQPTQPLREPKHITQALALLNGHSAVVSVARIPQAMSPPMACWIGDLSHYLCPFDAKRGLYGGEPRNWSQVATRRQETGEWYYRDGTVYAFRRRTVEETGTIYGHTVAPLIIPPEETCPLDTPADWLEAERRLRERAT